MITLSNNSANSRSVVIDRTRLSEIRSAKPLFHGRYKVIRVIGQGGFGITYLARDVSLPFHPFCVIKQLAPRIKNPLALQNARERFEREAEALSRLGSHAQIPRLLDYFETNHEFYLVQEYIRGSTLANEVKHSGPWSEIAVKQLLRQLLPLLQYIHRNQVIHRDIKPQNMIRCQDDGRLVLIDFGAIKEQIAATEVTAEQTSSTHFVGTIGYAPPEQLAMRPVFASDVYALGLTCLYLLTGKSPLQQDYDSETGETVWQHLVGVSDHFAKVLTKMLKLSLEDRYQSADEILRALNLEPYLDNLSPCLSSQPPVIDLDRAKEELLQRGYITSTARTAVAIRDLRKRLKVRYLRSVKFNPL